MPALETGITTKLVTLYHPQEEPFGGLISEKNPLALLFNEWVEADNIRIKDGVISARGGCTASLATILASGDHRGSWGGFLWGFYTVAVALYDGSRTRVYTSTSPGSWTELTASSGPFGNTRLTGNAPVDFEVVSDPFSVPQSDFSSVHPECLLVTDGTGAVRVAVTKGSDGQDVGGMTYPIVALLQDITPQTGLEDYPVRVRAIEVMLRNLQTAGTYTVPAAARMNFADQGTAPNMQARLTLDTTITNGDNVALNIGTGSSISPSLSDRQVLIGVDTSYPLLWDKLKVEVMGTTVWDPTAPQSYARPRPVSIDNSQRVVWIFKYPDPTSAGAVSGTLKFTWAAATTEAPTVDQTADIFLVALGYGSPAFDNWNLAVTNFNNTTRGESPGMIYGSYVMDRISDFGGPILNGVRLPRVGVFRAKFSAKIKNVSNTDRDRGVNAVNFYYQKPGESRFRFWSGPAGNVLTSLSGSTWSYGSGSAQTVIELVAGPRAQFYDLPQVYLPDAYHIVPPTSKCLGVANDRLMAGAQGGAFNSIYVSEYKNAFRMRRFTAYQNGEVEGDAPVTLGIGNRNPQAILPMSASPFGSSTVLIFTDQDVLVSGGSVSSQIQQLARVSGFGTVSPLSVCELNGKVFYLDTERQVRVLFGGQRETITRKRIADKFRAVPASRIAYVTSAVFSDLIYFGYTASGGTTNTKIGVWDDAEQQWVTDTPPIAANGLISWFDGTANKKRLLLIGSNGNCYEYDLSTQTQDLGTTNITVTLKTRNHCFFGASQLFTINAATIESDDIASATGTITRNYVTRGGSGASNISLDASNTKLTRESADPTNTGTCEDIIANVNFSLPMTAGAIIMRLAVEVQDCGALQYDKPA